MSSAASQPNLRLVGADNAAESQWHAREKARLAVMKENRLAAASGLDPADPRWVLAAQTRERLQGATLTPERRDQLLTTGQKLGLRPFESNLVIAIVQDQARTGGTLESARPALRLMSDSRREELTGRSVQRRPAAWPQWFAAIAGALAFAGVLIRWISGS